MPFKRRDTTAPHTQKLSVFNLPLDHESRECHLSSIRSHQNGQYLYEVTFPGSRSGWRGTIHVPEHKLDRAAKQAWTNHYYTAPIGPGSEGMPIKRSAATKGIATFLDLVSEKTSRETGKGMYVRGLEVEFKGTKYKGEALLLKEDPIMKEMIEWARDGLNARESIEGDDEDGLRKSHIHTVEFFGPAPKKGRKSEVEIWELDGDNVLFAGKVSVRSLEDDEDGTRELVIDVRIEGENYFLRGELRERMKVGRFMVIKENEA
ncbi:hypothetical protein AC579_6737 [Pseudocercospora musae]|uniref:Protein HRI1 n=1 Tax=Pseudocercospora musae TaxID=113226 RepID=A0A139H918_9PEZI|nr:hypothetical protein AC579_6737 [Pseudocercospora musae]